MLAVANRIYVNPDYADVFEDTFRRRSGLVDRMPGFISNQVLRPVNASDPYVILTFWHSRTEFEAWVQSDAFRQGHVVSGTLPKDVFSGPSKLEIYEIIQDSAQPALQPEPRGEPFHPHGSPAS